jgi:DNA topoisomerase VI subunit A
MYKTRISSDYFTKQGLENRTGILSGDWYIVLLKELIDNALDAIEANADKKITVEYSDKTLKIFDNGNGLSSADIQAMYDFDNYVTKNRHIINISRGKLGNGLKTVIGICQVGKYRLLWHTNENNIVCPQLDAENAQDGEIKVEFIRLDERTDFKGVEIQGINVDYGHLYTIAREFSECNNDVLFALEYNVSKYVFEPVAESTNKQEETSLLFYDFKEYRRLLDVQDGENSYKTFLDNYFGTRMRKASGIKGKIKDINMNDVESDFYALKQLQNTKPLTLLKKHLIGYRNIIESYPYIIEYKTDNTGWLGKNCVMVNNSITYFDAASVSFDAGEYQVTASKKINTNSLNEILNAYKDYKFSIHIITPKPIFKDFGKTEIDISDISQTLIDNIRKTVNKEKRKKPVDKADKPRSKKDLALENMDEAFNMASSGGKYSITARQMYYKLRELIGDDTWETEHTYNRFTQDWLTQWIDDNPQYEEKVNFSDRGTFIIGGVSRGIGSVNVRNFIAGDNMKENRFTVDADININSNYDFDVRYRYDKVLYIEKTGFNEIFQVEGVQEKYNMLIVSGQGYASRSARQLLYDLQQKGLKIYCMHDLDVAGMTIFDSVGRANDKFKYDIEIEDLGITPSDAARYNITPEKVKEADETRLEGFSAYHQVFFRNADGYSRRVELNAFTTEELLQIIDDKLRDKNGLPKIEISKVMKAMEQNLKKYALFQLVERKYEKMFQNISMGDIGQF